jgi:hypothetical protein
VRGAKAKSALRRVSGRRAVCLTLVITASLECDGAAGLKLAAGGRVARFKGLESCGVKLCGAKAALALGILLCTGHMAAAQLSLLPQGKRLKAEHGTTRAAAPVVIPEGFAPPQEAYAAFPEETATAAAPAAPSACQVRLQKIAMFQPIPTLVGAGECGAVDAVHLDAIILPDQNKVAVTPAGILRCPMAEELAHWVREAVAPLTQKLGSAVRVLDNFDSYSCRGRNRVRGALLSEHGRANAIDVRLFKLADGRSLGLTDVNVDKAWREAIKASVCARFATVLGPGSDGNHEEHIHLDLAERRNNYKLCEWDVREPPPPPAVARSGATPQVAAEQNVAPADDTAADDTDESAQPLDVVPLPRPRPKLAGVLSRAKKSDPN